VPNDTHESHLIWLSSYISSLGNEVIFLGKMSGHAWYFGRLNTTYFTFISIGKRVPSLLVWFFLSSLSIMLSISYIFIPQ